MKTTVFRALVRKDLQVFLSDRRAVIMSFALPIAFASFFGFLFGGRGGDHEQARIAVRVVDEDASPLSARVAAALAADPRLDAAPATLADARDAVRRGKVTAAIRLPAGFGIGTTRAVGGGERPRVELLHDPSRAVELAVVRGLLTQHVLAEVGRASGIEMRLPYELDEQAVTGDDVPYDGYAHSFAGMGVQFMLMAAIETALALLLQRQRGLWKRLRAAPLSRTMLLGSRLVSGAIISLLILAVLFGFGAAVFGVRVAGNFAGFAAVCAAAALMASAFGLLIAAVGRTPEATRGLAIFVTLVVVMLGGAWVPSFLFPPWLQRISLVTPTRWAVDGLDGAMWRGLGLGYSLQAAAVLLGFAVAFGALALTRFRWEEA